MRTTQRMYLQSGCACATPRPGDGRSLAAAAVPLPLTSLRPLSESASVKDRLRDAATAHDACECSRAHRNDVL